MDFHGLAQGCAFWGFNWYSSPFWGWSAAKTPILGAWIGFFKPNWRNIGSFILSKLLDFSQILHNDRDHQVVIARGPNTRSTNPKWRTAAILKKRPLNRHISATVWPILMKFGTMTYISIFWKSKMAANTFLKMTEIEISPQWFDRSLRNLVQWCKMGFLTTPTVKNWISKIQDGGWPPFWKWLNRHISATVWPILMTFGILMHIGPLQWAGH